MTTETIGKNRIDRSNNSDVELKRSSGGGVVLFVYLPPSFDFGAKRDEHHVCHPPKVNGMCLNFAIMNRFS